MPQTHPRTTTIVMMRTMMPPQGFSGQHSYCAAIIDGGAQPVEWETGHRKSAEHGGFWEPVGYALTRFLNEPKLISGQARLVFPALIRFGLLVACLHVAIGRTSERGPRVELLFVRPSKWCADAAGRGGTGRVLSAASARVP